MTPPTIRMRLLVASTINGITRPAGSVIELGVDVARHLSHRRRAVAANAAALNRLLDAPRALPG